MSLTTDFSKTKASTSKMRLRREEVALLSRQLGTLVQANIPLTRSLQILIRQEKNKKAKRVLEYLWETVYSGDPLSIGMAYFPRTFDSLFINIMRAGEKSGSLDIALTRIARFLERSVQTKKKLKAALTYPSIVMSVAFMIVGVLITTVVPKFESMFHHLTGQKTQLPILTQSILKISEFLAQYMFILLGFGIFFILSIWMIAQTKNWHRLKDKWLLRLPYMSGFIEKIEMNKFARTLATLLENGVPIIPALSITRDVLGNKILADALNQSIWDIQEGKGLTQAIEDRGVFPEIAIRMIEIGEETGELNQILDTMGKNYEDDLDFDIAKFLGLLEPVTIIVLAITVGVIVFALFLPIVSLIEGMSL